MPTAPSANHSVKTEPRREAAALAQQARDQLASTIQQGRQVSVETVHTWAEALSALPLRKLSRVPRFLALPVDAVEAATNFVFDVAADLLDAQREFALALVRVFASEKSS